MSYLSIFLIGLVIGAFTGAIRVFFKYSSTKSIQSNNISKIDGDNNNVTQIS